MQKQNNGAEPLLLRPSEAFRVASIGRSTGYKLIAAGEWPVVKIGPRGIRVPIAALHAWIEKNASTPRQSESQVIKES